MRLVFNELHKSNVVADIVFEAQPDDDAPLRRHLGSCKQCTDQGRCPVYERLQSLFGLTEETDRSTAFRDRHKPR